MENNIPQFDDATWEMLPSFFDRLPEKVLLNIWGDENASDQELEAVRLAKRLSQRFETIEHQVLPQRIDFHYYPVIGAMRLSDDEPVDYGVRIVGLPAFPLPDASGFPHWEPPADGSHWREAER